MAGAPSVAGSGPRRSLAAAGAAPHSAEARTAAISPASPAAESGAQLGTETDNKLPIELKTFHVRLQYWDSELFFTLLSLCHSLRRKWGSQMTSWKESGKFLSKI